jgi:hypothetical protein
MRGLFFFILSKVVFSITNLIGFVYSLRYLTTPKKFYKDLDRKLYQSAISEDQFGNIWLKEILNDTCIQVNGHRYGDEDQTVSEATGINERDKTLTSFGVGFTRFLSFVLGKNHALESIDEA